MRAAARTPDDPGSLNLPLGGNDPHEIAIRIAAQLLERKQAKPG